MKCLACNATIIRGQLLACITCRGTYHYKCLNITEAYFLGHSRDLKLNWKCPTCASKASSRKDDNTPARGTLQQARRNDSPPMLDDSKVIPEVHSVNAAPGGASDITSPISIPDQSEHPEVISPILGPGGVGDITQFKQYLKQFQDIFDNMKGNMQALSNSLSSCQNEMAEFRQEISDMRDKIRSLEQYESEVKALRIEVLELKSELAQRDQQQLSNDIELNGITEIKGENLQQIVDVIATKLGVDLDVRDVDCVRRVGRRRTDDDGEIDSEQRPRPVVLRMTRRAPRDQILRAARVRRTLTTDQIEVPGAPRRVYINEHLTRANRILYGKTRAFARENGFKYAWVRNGQVHLRRVDQGRIYWIRSEEDLRDMIRKDTDTNSNFQN